MEQVSILYIVYIPENWKNGAVYIVYIASV